MPLSITQTIRELGGTWVVNATAKLPFGDATDSATLDKATLVLRKRAVQQGPMTVELSFADGKATGTVAMGGEPKPVSLDLGGEVFADGPGSSEVLALLPLAEGYATSFRNLDVQRQKPTLKQLKVVGQEDVAVPAGTFKAWKAEITSAEGEPGQTTIWIAADSRKVVKTSMTLPQMGGAVITLELQP
jgi:hypothetical protein